MKIVITGGTGFLGRHLTSYLKSFDHEIILISRSDLKEGLERISKLVKSSDVLINLAGTPVIKRWNNHNKNEILSSRLDTTNMLVESIAGLAPGERPRLVISASAIGIYNSVKVHTESSEDFENNFLAEVCRQWESRVSPLRQMGIRLCVIRIGIVLGKEGGMLQKLIPLFKFGLGGKIGSGKQSFSFIHYHDLCRAIEFFIKNSECVGIYNLTSPEISNNKEFTAALARACHRPAFFTVPKIVLKLVYGKAAVAMIQGQSAYPTHLLEDGFEFKYADLEAALQNILTQ